MEQGYSILRGSDILDENYSVYNISSRETQIERLSACLSPALKRKKPIHAWIFGRPGTGKTLVAKHVLMKLKKESRIGGICINCWEHGSYYSVLDKLVRELRILGAEKLNTSFKLERLKHFLGNRPFIIILDEIDKLKKAERDSTIYNLGNIGNVGLICISNSPFVLYSLDERIRSRLNAKLVEFSPYTKSELVRILKQRADMALNNKAWSTTTLGKVAELAGGDARIAIKTLKNAAVNAENDFNRKIYEKHIKEGYHSAKDLKTTYLLNELSSHHRLLYEIVNERREINSGMLWKEYLGKCRKLEKRPIAQRTFSEYMNKLIELDLVQWDRALVRGKVRVFKVN